MGLAIVVGYLADMLENDPEGALQFQAEMDRLNGFLSSAGLDPHIEPERCEIYSCDMFGYSGVHYLRRIAAHLDLRGTLPVPGDHKAADDQILDEYLRAATSTAGSFWDRLFARPPRSHTFDHLLLHSDAEGYYLPQDFTAVLSPPEDLEIPGVMVGSSIRLRQECRRLADALQLPLDLDPEADVVWEAAQSQGEGDSLWQRYGVESFTCLRLHAAATHSIRHGAAIVFT